MLDYLDIFTTILGLLYIWLEYRASIWLWLVGVVLLDFWTLQVVNAICIVAFTLLSIQPINRLEKFSYELRDHSAYYTMDEWKEAAEKFVDIRKDIKKHEFEYTAEQKKKIGVLEGKCAGYMAKGAKEGIFDKIKGIGNEINGILQGILNAVTNFVE